MPENEELLEELKTEGREIGTIFRHNLVLVGVLGTLMSFTPNLFGKDSVLNFIKSEMVLLGFGFVFAAILASLTGLLYRWGATVDKSSLGTAVFGGNSEQGTYIQHAIRTIKRLTLISQFSLILGLSLIVGEVLTLFDTAGALYIAAPIAVILLLIASIDLYGRGSRMNVFEGKLSGLENYLGGFFDDLFIGVTSGIVVAYVIDQASFFETIGNIALIFFGILFVQLLFKKIVKGTNGSSEN